MNQSLTGAFAVILVAVFQVNALHDFMRVTRESVKACPVCFGYGETQEKALKKCDQNTKYQNCPPDLLLPVCVTQDIKTGSVLQLMAHEVTRQCLSSIGFYQSSFGYQEHICLEAMGNRGNNKPCVIGKCDEDRCKAEIPDLD